MNKRTRRKCTTFCGTLQIEIPVKFIRDRMKGESGGAQNPKHHSFIPQDVSAIATRNTVEL